MKPGNARRVLRFFLVMRMLKSISLAVSLCAVSACGTGQKADADGSADAAPDPSPRPASTAQSEGVDDGTPDLTTAPLTPEAERTETGARALLLSWGRAIELEEFAQAYRMMGEAGAQRWSARQFRDIFSGLGEITVELPDGTMEGAAGSSYYSLDVTITAPDKDGRPIRIEGPLVLRRVNDVPGSSEEARRWQFESIDLAVTH